VEAVPPGQGEDVYFDTDLNRFGLRVYPSGRRSYFVQYRNRSGRTRKYGIGPHGVFTVDEARKEARSLLADADRGGDPAAERRRLRKAPTMADLCDRFLAEYANEHCKPTTFRDYRSYIRRLIRPELGAILVEEVTRADILRLHHALRKTPYQANRTVAMLSKMLNTAEDWGWRAAGTNPARRIKKNRETDRRRYLTSEEQTQLGQVLRDCLGDGSESVYVVSAILLLMLTGCRPDEIRTLRWDYITRHHLELPDSKTGRRRIPLPREARAVLDRIPQCPGNPYVILGNAPDRPIVNLQKPWRRIRDRAGLAHLRLHDLRHTYASVAMQQGVDPFTLKDILGHKNLATTLRYAHLDDDAIQRAAGSVAASLGSAIAWEVPIPTVSGAIK